MQGDLRLAGAGWWRKRSSDVGFGRTNIEAGRGASAPADWRRGVRRRRRALGRSLPRVGAAAATRGGGVRRRGHASPAARARRRWLFWRNFVGGARWLTLPLPPRWRRDAVSRSGFAISAPRAARAITGGGSEGISLERSALAGRRRRESGPL